MENSKTNPGNANLPIGVRKNATPEIGVPGAAGQVWHSRGYLPHFESSAATQHVTFHLADSLPQGALRQLESQLKIFPVERRDIERRKRVDAWIDAGHGSCFLGTPRVAEMVQASLLKFDAQHYRLLAWVVMPNHVHVLFQPAGNWTVAKIVASWKKFTPQKICDDQRGKGHTHGDPVWHREYWDRYIRDRSHLEQTIEYIHLNPVKAGLVVTPEKWRWSSAYFSNSGGSARI